MSMKQFILASNSPRRKELLSFLNLPMPVSVFAVNTNEYIEANWTPAEAVQRLSMQKALAVHKRLVQGNCPKELQHKTSCILSADTVVVLEGEILGKPTDEQDAWKMLNALQGKTHQVYTGISLLLDRSELQEHWESEITQHSFSTMGNNYREITNSLHDDTKLLVGYTESHVTFREINEDEIRAYIHTGIPMDKAGSYGVQGLGAIFVDKIDGDFYSIMGLPINLLYKMLKAEGVYTL